MKKFVSYGSLLLTLAYFFAVAPGLADTLKLRNGQTVEGKFLGGTDAKIDFLAAGRVQSHDVADVESLTFAGTPFENSTESGPTSHAANALGAGPASAGGSNSSSGSAAGSSETLPAGTMLVVRMIDSVDSSVNKVGDTFHASLEQPLVVNDTVVARKGADIYGHLIQAQQAGHFEGKSELRLALTGIRIGNQVVPIVTGAYDVAGKSRGEDSAEKIGGGAGLGALIGAIAGHGKGAAIGAGVGAAAGTVVQIVTHGEEVHVPSETVLNFTLEQPVTIPAAAGTEGLYSETRSR
jgi:hypothetical protein